VYGMGGWRGSPVRVMVGPEGASPSPSYKCRGSGGWSFPAIDGNGCGGDSLSVRNPIAAIGGEGERMAGGRVPVSLDTPTP